MKEFNASARGLISLAQDPTHIDPTYGFVREFVDPEWHFTESGIDSDLDTLRDLVMMMSGEVRVVAKPTNDQQVKVKLYMRKG